MNRKSIALTLAFMVVLVIGQKPMSAEEPSNVSLVQVIANPDQFNGKAIQVVGYLTVGFEDVELYLHREDAEHALYKNGVWVELSRAEMKKYSRLNLKYVIVEGVFDSKQLGHMSSTSGAIVKIRRLEVLPTNTRVGHPAP